MSASNGLSPRSTPAMGLPSELKNARFREVFDLTAQQVEARLGRRTGDITLIQALDLGDGSGYTQLARAGTAALLNACALGQNYAPLANPAVTSATIIADVKGRFLSNDRANALARALVYDGYNNSTCILDNSGTTATARTGYKAEMGATEQNITMTAFPNPAYGEATIEFTVAKTEQTSVLVYSLTGNKVQTLFDGVAEGGKVYRVTLKSSDRVVPGAYIYRVQSDSSSKASRLIMVKQ